MTEIKIEKKKPIWPWILLVLIILGIIAYFVYANSNGAMLNDDNDDFDDDYVNEQVMESNDSRYIENDSISNTKKYGGVYDAYQAFDESSRDSTRIAMDSSYTKKAFANLNKLVVRQADKNNIETSPQLEDLRSFSSLITSISKTSNTETGFKNFKTLCDKIASVMGDIQQKSYPALESEVTNLKELAEKVNISTPMNQQQESLNAFLRKSRDILKSMN